MEVFSCIVLALLSLVGYSAGVVAKAGKRADVKPHAIDLLIVLLIWVGAVCSKLAMDLNRWFLFLVWIIISSIIGVFAIWPRRPSTNTISISEETQENAIVFSRRIWQDWKRFSRRIGSFQSRLILSLFFFVVATPFALGVKIFSDPLNVKHRVKKSYWQKRRYIGKDEVQYRRQF